MGKRGPKPKRREVVWSSELAYAIGLIASDGCLSSDGRHLDVTSKDKDQIKSLTKCLGLEHIKIGLKNKGQAYRIQWGDVVLYEFLLDIGLTPHKSRTIGELSVPDQYFLDFLRGSFDGDGSFYSYFDPRWRSSFMYYLCFSSASVNHINWLRNTIERLLKVRGHISKIAGRGNYPESALFTLRYAKREALIVMRAMYDTRCPYHLARKRLKIERALRIVGVPLLGQS